MDGDLIQQKIHSGLAKAAQRLGRAHLHYRPTLALSPIGEGSLLGSVLATFTTKGSWYPFSTSSGPENRTFHALVDGAAVAVGDYLVREDGTFFIAEVGHIAPILAYKCNITASIRRPGQPSAVGLNGYGGDIPAQETVLAAGWPIPLLAGTKGSHGALPSDPNTSSFSAVLPPIPGVTLQPGDIIVDHFTQRFHIKAAVFSGVWSVMAAQVIS